MGFLKLNRKFFNNPLWKEDRVYSKAEAWLDLVSSAWIDAGSTFINGKDIEVLRGELPAARRYLEKRWNWGSTKVNNFLSYLKRNKMITTKQTNGQTIIKLVKYEVYNDSQTTKQTNDKPRTNQRQTKVKNIKERKEVFYKQVIEYSAQYDFQELEKFYDYWSEHNEQGKKMKFEKLQTFNLKSRIKTWFSNKKEWEKENKPSSNNRTVVSNR